MQNLHQSVLRATLHAVLRKAVSLTDIRRLATGKKALMNAFLIGVGVATSSAQTPVIDFSRFYEPGYLQTSSPAVVLTPLVNVKPLSIQANMGAQWQGFGQRWSTAHDWSQYKVFSFVLQNLEARTVNLTVQLEYSPGGADPGRLFKVIVTLAPGQTLPVSMDMVPDGTAQYGMRGLPPVLTGPHLRHFNWSPQPMNTTYGWWMLNRDAQPTRIKVWNIALHTRPDTYTNLIDAFGQYAGDTWLNKVLSPTDLSVQYNAELADRQANPNPPNPDGVQFQTGTGRWGLGQNKAGKWFFVTPQGKAFWSLGMCNVTTKAPTVIQNRLQLFNALPPNSGSTAQFYGTDQNGRQTFDFGEYNLSRKLPTWSPSAFGDFVVGRLKNWGFNTLSAWCDGSLYQRGDMPYTVAVNTLNFPTRLQTEFQYWSSLPDPYAANFQAWTASTIGDAIVGHNGRPSFMGIYIDSELSWGQMETTRRRYQIAIGALNASSTQPAKVAFIAQLQARYPTIQALNSAWGSNYASWASLQAPNAFTLQNINAACEADLAQFVTSFATTYYSKVRAALNQVNCTALYLGSRECFWTPEVISASMPYIDVFSITLYRFAEHVDWSFPLSTKPVIIAEVSYGATDRGMFHPGPVPVLTQQDRANAIRDYLNAAGAAPKVVGVNWFLYRDQPTSGRTQDGENFNVGMVSIADTPYWDLVPTFRNFYRNVYAQRGF